MKKKMRPSLKIMNQSGKYKKRNEMNQSESDSSSLTLKKNTDQPCNKVLNDYFVKI